MRNAIQVKTDEVKQTLDFHDFLESSGSKRLTFKVNVTSIAIRNAVQVKTDEHQTHYLGLIV